MVNHKPCFPCIGTALLDRHVALLALPLGYVGVVGTLSRLGVNIFGILNKYAAIGAHMTELAILANIYLILGNVPVLFKLGMI